MFIDDMKKSILQKAIQWKLVEQNPNDEPASELLKRIRDEKEKLIKDGKIKKEKGLSPITDEEKPFDIPSSWGWTKIEEISYPVWSKFNQIQSKEELKEWKFPAVSQWQSLIDGYSNDEDKVIDDLPLVMFGDHTRNVKYIDFPFVISADWTKFFKPVLCDYRFIFYLIQYSAENLRNRWYARHYSLLKETRLPLPPLEEQERIVAKLDELMPLLDEARPLEEEITKLEKDFPSKLRQSILQYAIQWKLVEQNSADEPANELLKKIKEEKEKLIKEWKIKKEKPLEPITDEEKPFDIPTNWEWVRLGSLWAILWGKRIPAWRSLSKEDTGYKYIRVSDMKNYSVSLDNIQFVPKDIYPSISRYIINKEDVYITVAWTIWRVWKVPPELDWANLTENADRIVINNINQDWLIYCLGSDLVQSQISSATTQVWQPKLAIKRIQDLLIPLPPLEEQKRIVAKLDELMKLCDELEEQIG